MCSENEELDNKDKNDCPFFVIKMVKFNRPLQKPIETDQDNTSNIKASYNKGIHTVVITYYL